MQFAVTKMLFTFEEKLDLLLMLIVIIKIYRHYEEVKGTWLQERLHREREILESTLYSEATSTRSYSLHSTGSHVSY